MKEALKIDPMSKEALGAMADLYMQGRDYAGVEEKLRKIVEIDPGDLRAQADLGEFLLARRQYREAEEIYRKIKEQDPDDDTVCVRLARLYTSQGRSDMAREELEACAKTGFISDDLLKALVQLYMEGKRYGDAIALCEKRISKDREDLLALNLLGTIHIRLKEYGKAETTFLRAVEIDPDFGPALMNLAALREIQGRIEDAFQYLDDAIQANPQDVSGYVTFAMLFDEIGDFAKAMKTYERGIDANPGSWILKNNLAFMICHRFDTRQDLERALGLATEAHETQSDNPIVLDTLGWANWRLDNFEEAYHYLYRALMVDPENCSANYHLAVVLKAMGKDNQARERLIKALDGEEEFAGKNEAEVMLKEMATRKQGSREKA
jgi:tetratricopeptide (TPR) repeat protein